MTPDDPTAETIESPDSPPGDTPPAPSPLDDAAHLLLRFLHNRDVACPKCSYNLRNLTQPVCPECCEPVRLAVTVGHVPLAWVILAIIPCAFSAICAAFLAVPIVYSSVINPSAGPVPPGIVVLDAFGWTSGLVGLGLFLRRGRFVHLAVRTQIMWVIILWAAHLAAFVLMILLAI